MCALSSETGGQNIRVGRDNFVSEKDEKLTVSKTAAETIIEVEDLEDISPGGYQPKIWSWADRVSRTSYHLPAI